jgi:hypothetical protein
VGQQDVGGAMADQPELVQVVLEQAGLQIVLLHALQAAQQLEERYPCAGPDIGRCEAWFGVLVGGDESGRRGHPV